MSQLQRKAETRVLMNVPQKWGILPTLWFWRAVEIPAPLRRASRAVGLLSAVLLVVAFISMGAMRENTRWLLYPIAIVLEVLQLGLTERWLRRKIMARREHYAALEAAAQQVTPSHADVLAPRT